MMNAMVNWAMSQIDAQMSAEQRERYLTIYALYSKAPQHREPVPFTIESILDFCPYKLDTQADMYQRCVCV